MRRCAYITKTMGNIWGQKQKMYLEETRPYDVDIRRCLRDAMVLTCDADDLERCGRFNLAQSKLMDAMQVLMKLVRYESSEVSKSMALDRIDICVSRIEKLRAKSEGRLEISPNMVDLSYTSIPMLPVIDEFMG